MRRLARNVTVIAAVWLLAGVPASAPAQSEELGGFEMGAVATGFTWTYDDPNSPIPSRPTGEQHVAYSLATLEFGPSGHGVAAELWPGETPATVPPFIEQSFWEGFEGGFRDNGSEPPMTNPNVAPRWPLAAETFEPQGPKEQSVEPNARSLASANLVVSEANSTPIALPGVVEVEDVASTARSEVAGASVTASVTSTASGISILGGFVEIGAVETDASVTSDTEDATVAGKTVVSGLRIDGHSFTIDRDGIHADGEDHDNPILGQLESNVFDRLAEEGLSITLVEGIETVSGAQGAMSMGGLIVRMDSRHFEAFVDQLPEDLQNTLRGSVGLSTDHTMTLILGAANVQAVAAPAFSFDDFSFDFGGGDFDGGSSDFGTAPPVSVAGAGATAGLPSGAPVPAGDSTPPAPAPVPRQDLTTQQAFSGPIEPDGVGAGAVILGLGAILLGARLMQRMADTLLSRE